MGSRKNGNSNNSTDEPSPIVRLRDANKAAKKKGAEYLIQVDQMFEQVFEFFGSTGESGLDTTETVFRAQSKVAVDAESLAWNAWEGFYQCYSVFVPFEITKSTNPIETLVKVREFASPAEFFGRVNDLAWTMIRNENRRQTSATTDLWLAAKEHVLTMVRASTEVAGSASEFHAAFSGASSTLSTGSYIDFIERLAERMYWSSRESSAPIDPLGIWIAAEKHVKVITAAAIQAANSAGETGAALTRSFERFSIEDYLDYISTAAYYISRNPSNRQFSLLKNWLRGEEEVLEKIDSGSVKVPLFFQTRRLT